MRRLFRTIALILVCAMLAANPVLAAGGAATFASSHFESRSVDFFVTSSSNLKVEFTVVATGTMQELGVSLVAVECSEDGGETWDTVKSWIPSRYPSMLAENKGSHSGSLTYTGTVSSYCLYRAYVVFYARNSSGTGSAYIISDPITI